MSRTNGLDRVEAGDSEGAVIAYPYPAKPLGPMMYVIKR